MAVRFDNAADNLQRTSSLPSTNTYSCCFWAKIAADNNYYSAFFGFTDPGGGFYTVLETNADGTEVMWADNNGGVVGIQQLTVGSWYFFAITKSNTDVVIYVARDDDAALTSTNIPSNAATPAHTLLTLGDDGYSEPLNGCMEAFKMWDGVALTAAEVEAERWQNVPSRTEGLYAWLPLVNAEGVDYSGAANPFTVNGALALEDGPPIAWRKGISRILIPATAGGGATAVPVFMNQYRQRGA